MPFRVKAGEAREIAVNFFAVDFIFKLVAVRAFIDKINFRAVGERHEPVRIKPAVLRIAAWQGTIRVGTGRGAEKIPQRCPNGGRAFAIPADLQRDLAEQVAVRRQERRIETDADAGDRSGTIRLVSGAAVAGEPALAVAGTFTIGISTRRAMAEPFVRFVERSIGLRGQCTLKHRHLRGGRIGRVTEMIIRAPIFVRDDLARFLKRDRRVIIAAHGSNVDQRGPRERGPRAGKIIRKWQIHDGIGSAIEIDAHVTLLRCGGPDAPDAARSAHFRQHIFAVLLPDDTVVVAIGIPVNVLPGFFVIAAGPVVAGKLRGLFAWFRQSSQMFEIGETVDQIHVSQHPVFRFGTNGRHGGSQKCREDNQKNRIHSIVHGFLS